MKAWERKVPIYDNRGKFSHYEIVDDSSPAVLPDRNRNSQGFEVVETISGRPYYEAGVTGYQTHPHLGYTWLFESGRTEFHVYPPHEAPGIPVPGEPVPIVELGSPPTSHVGYIAGVGVDWGYLPGFLIFVVLVAIGIILYA
jgi:hypothetical protein